MSDQADNANKAIRKLVGDKVVDDAVAASNFTVLPSGGDSGGGEGEGHAKLHWVKLPTLKWLLSQMGQQVGQVMATEEMFTRESVPVIVDPKKGKMLGVTAQKLRSELEKWLVFWKGKPAQNDEGEDITVKVPVTMTVDVARGLLECSEFVNRLRPLNRVNKVRMPVAKKDGRHRLLPEGYDDETGIYTLRSELKIDEAMPLDKAKAVFHHWLKEFPFEDKRSHAVMITAMVSLFGTCMLPDGAARMGFLWRSNDRGGGKSLLAQLAVVATFGKPATTDIRDRNKLAEALDSAALQSDPYLFFDNLEGTVKNTMIDNFITSPARRVRLFHTQHTPEVDTCTQLLFTGNNLEVSPDIDRRTLLCRLFVPEFDLTERELENSFNVVRLLQPAVRAELLGAMWALVRNWEDAGRPTASLPNRKNFVRPSFEEWSEMFGGIVQAAGYGNPLVLPADDKAASPERVQQRRLVECLAAKIAMGETRRVIPEFEEIVDICYQEELFSEKLLEGSKTLTSGPDDAPVTTLKLSNPATAWLGRFMAMSVVGRPEGREYILPPAKPGGAQRKAKIGYDGKGKTRVYWVEWV